MNDIGETLEKDSVVSEKYRIEGVIGAGGMGTVYRARNIATMRRVAIKVLDKSLVANNTMIMRFRREAKAPALIAHSGVCDVYDVGETECERPYLVMEYLEGETLQERIARDGALPVHDAVMLVADVLDAIGAAHLAGIIHRDLKPANIFLTKTGRCKVLDFGILKFADYLEQTALTKSGIRMGTPFYMAPEQMRSARNATQESDLYSVGAILYAALAGRPPFHAKSYADVVVKVQTEPHRPLRELNADVPQALSEVVDRMLSKSPLHRPHTAEAARDLLLEAIGLLLAIPESPTKPNRVRDLCA